MLSIATDYVTGSGSADPYLREIAKAGFTHIHWCQEWCSDYLYPDREIAELCVRLNALDLHVTDVHASAGREAMWAAPDEARRAPGVELVKNRIRMASMLASDVIVLHLPYELEEAGDTTAVMDATRRSLDELTAFGKNHGVRIALENMPKDNTATITALLADYPADVLGLCYDSGHGNIAGNGLERLDGLKQRLIAIHLHDNDGTADQHCLPFDGTVDWTRLTGLIAASSYRKPINLEVSSAAWEDKTAFLTEARIRGARLEGLVYAMR